MWNKNQEDGSICVFLFLTSISEEVPPGGVRRGLSILREYHVLFVFALLSSSYGLIPVI